MATDPPTYQSGGEGAAGVDPGLKVDAGGAAFWRRVLYMVGYSFIGYFVQIALFAVALVQAVFTLVSGHRSGEITALARNLTTYLTEVMAFVSWASDEKPFPAGKFPDEAGR
jgi:hypothetical protein